MDCHSGSAVELGGGSGSVALVGHPNVGKSVIFHKLTGRYATVSNYPGTTIQVTSGTARILEDATVIDTPGVIAFPSRTEDEYATTYVLLHEPLQAIVQVGDAKNLRRTLLLTIQLAEMGLPFVLALNMMDEADANGVQVDGTLLSEHLAVEVVPMVAIRGEGVQGLAEAIPSAKVPQFRVAYPAEIEVALAGLATRFPEAPIANRALALLWLAGDLETGRWLRERVDPDVYEDLAERREALQRSFVEPLSVVIQDARLAYVDVVASGVIVEREAGKGGFARWLGNLAIHPLWGLPVLAVILYATYWFVGIFGGGTLVELLETRLFGGVINPWLTEWVTRLIPVPILSDLLVGDYGLWTMAMTYALALILPIVTTFFLAFGFLEDTGYIPRLAVLTNRLFRMMGLNGKAVLPMVLGLGCVTMATLTTRVLESKRERLLTTLLLALAVPCSAQLGVVMGMLAGISFTATIIWSLVVLGILLIVGWLASRVIPGERSELLVELPPLRFPSFSNLLIKTVTRLEWYLKEVVPLFLLGTALLFLFDKTGVLSVLISAGEPVVAGWLGLPPEASTAFLLGFLRRDFGATGLFVMQSQGLLSPTQALVAMVTVTLFIPCVASVFMMVKERGWRVSIAMVAFILPLAFLVGGVLNRLLVALRWTG